jgi:hypothetical protein
MKNNEVGSACGMHGRGEESVGRLRCRWEDGIRMDLTETGCRGVEWIHLAQDRDWWQALMNAVMNLSVHRVSSLVSSLSRVYKCTTKEF